MNDQAVTEYLKEQARLGKAAADIDALKAASAASGMKGNWRKQLELLKDKVKQRPVGPLELAGVYAETGEQEQALESLEKACDQHDPRLISLKVNPTFDGLRSDPRFQTLLRRVGPTN